MSVSTRRLISSRIGRTAAIPCLAGDATFETHPPSREELDAKWLPDHRWVATIDGDVVGWTATADHPSGVA